MPGRKEPGLPSPHLLDTEAIAWVNGQTVDVATGVSNEETDFDAEVDKDLQQAEADESLATAQADSISNMVHAQALGTVTETEAGRPKEASDAVTTEAQDWQTDEHQAVLDDATHDNAVTAQAVANANAEQNSQDAWEQTESQAAHDDQRAVAQDRRRIVPADSIEQIDDGSKVIGLRVDRESIRSFL